VITTTDHQAYVVLKAQTVLLALLVILVLLAFPVKMVTTDNLEHSVLLVLWDLKVMLALTAKLVDQEKTV